jgi:predicted regulator of Ras-like GTPase activity (Roadblock/LC7/MglB family)
MISLDDTRAGRLAATLDAFVRSTTDVVAAAVISVDGLPMSTAVPDEVEEARLAAMSAALLSLAEQTCSQLGRGGLKQLFLEGEHGHVFLMSAEDTAVLATVTTREAKIGFILYEMRRAAGRVATALRSGELEDRVPADGTTTTSEALWTAATPAAEPRDSEPVAAGAVAGRTV